MNTGDIVTVQTGVVDDVFVVGSSVGISIPTEDINVNYNLPAGLSTATALRNSLFTMLSNDATITAEFVVRQDVADAQTTGVTAGQPIITLTANDNIDHALAVTFNNGDTGDLSSSRFGSHIEGSPPGVSTEVRVTYDSSLSPTTQDIVLGQTADNTATATVLADMISGHGGLTAAVTRNGVAAGGTVATGLQRGRTSVGPDIDVNVGGYVFANQDETSTIITGDYTPPNRFRMVFNFSNVTVGEAAPGTRWLIEDTNGTTSVTGTIIGVTTDDRDDVIVTFIRDAGTGAFADNSTINITAPEVAARIRVTTSQSGVFSAPTIAVTTAGTTDNLPTFTVATFSTGRDPIIAAGTRSSFSATYDGVRVIAPTTFTSGANAETVGAAIRTAVNSLTSHTATGNNPFTATSTANSPDDLIVTITSGVNDDGTIPCLLYTSPSPRDS